ncbi:proteasome assembly chaperone family protein [Candidatus Bathyarchaeota archaeon]|nr:MAG: proteasome assembly chaperone family protein [Candidatus Bathyarchaeota archaeon]
MKNTQIREIFRPELKDPVLVIGLPGIGNIGKIVSRLLIEFSRASLFAELYSPTFPDYVFINNKGICRPPKYEFFASTTGRNLVILTGDSQPALEEIPAHYEVCSDVLDYAVKLGCRSVITIAGAVSPQPTHEVYVAAISKKEAQKCVENGAVIYRGGKIVGAHGILLGLAEIRGLTGFCLLGSTSGFMVDREAALRVYKVLRRVLGTDVQEGL